MKKRKHINLCDHQNNAVDIAETSSQVINNTRTFLISSKNLSFQNNREFCPQLQLVLLLRINRFWFSWVLQVSGNWQKTKRNYAAADDYTEKMRVWRASRIFDFVHQFFSQKIQDNVLSLEIQLILSIPCL